MADVVTSPPEQGQLVYVRSRNWIVSDNVASSVPPGGLATGLELPEHLLTLSSVEDDGMGEELQVIWELELAPVYKLWEAVVVTD